MKVINVRSVFLQAEGSKSILNRVLLLSTHSKKAIQFGQLSNCDDVVSMVDNLKRLQFQVKTHLNPIELIPPDLIPSRFDLEITDSATVLRFLITRLSALPKRSFRITFSRQLSRRPLYPLLDLLYQFGVSFTLRKNSISFDGTTWKGGKYSIKGNISSQYISAILLNTPTLKHDLELDIINESVSEQYIQMTLKILNEWGIQIEKHRSTYFLAANQVLKPPLIVKIEPDYSSLAYFWAIGAISSEKVITEFQETSLQSDFDFLAILEKMGAKVEKSSQSVAVSHAHLSGITVSMKTMPDQVPTLAVLALFAESKTIIQEIDHLQYKESDRIQAIIQEFKKIGADISYSDSALVILPLRKNPPEVMLNTYQDHRLVMAFSILRLVYPQLRLNDTSSVTKSNPSFFDQIQSIRSSS